ncbi:MAG TPA: hypothetical protein DDY93_00770 [Dehalococcoidia bacterium]|nr:hypothetical protein [Dehalococcoidia bacterium]
MGIARPPFEMVPSGPVEMEMFGYLDPIARSGIRKGTAPTRACPIRPPRFEGSSANAGKITRLSPLFQRRVYPHNPVHPEPVEGSA